MRRFYIGLIDFLLLVISFFAIHMVKYGSVYIESRHESFAVSLVLTWMILAAVFKKFFQADQGSLSEGFQVIVLSALMMAGLISLFIVMGGHIEISRALMYGTVFLYATLELVVFWCSRAFVKPPMAEASSLTLDDETSVRFGRSALLITANFFLVLFSIVVATYLKRGELKISEANLDILFMFIGGWLATSLLLRKFSKSNFNSIYNVWAISVKSTLAMLIFLGLILFGLRYYYLSRGQIFGSLLIFAVLEWMSFYLYYRYRSYSQKNEREQATAAITLRNTAGHNHLRVQEKEEVFCGDPVDSKIRHALDFFEPELYDFIRENVDISKISTSRSVLMFSDTIFNLAVLPENRCELIVNLHKINDMRYLNRYLLLVHEKLKVQGYLIGRAHTLATHHSFFLNQFSTQPYLARVMYVFDFIWNRILPKLPFFQKIYFALTKGRDRLLSRAEILGRLYFCGFLPFAEKEISDRFYFVARKVKTPSKDPSPTYGPLVTLKRFGINDKPIEVFKFRTMHPYSEYLQEYVYKHGNLEKGGKFKHDFRITSWGAFMRKFWIDELPMLYNWIRGDLQLVGVRPLSKQYLELYGSELRELRRKVKPGLLPPFYADMPKTLEEIMDSERRYIEAYLKHPFRTQIIYFFKCVYNIVWKRARSG